MRQTYTPDKLFINLKILENIQKNGKISRSCDGLISLESDSYFQAVKRFINSDSRKQTIYEINSIVNEAAGVFDNIYNSRYMTIGSSDEFKRIQEELVMLTDEFTKAQSGVTNLRFTYIGDLNTTSQLDIILLRMNNIIRDANEKIRHITPLQIAAPHETINIF
jgi:hypothetical protein